MSALPMFAETKIINMPAPPEAEYSISEMSREFGVTLRALRFYEDRGLLNPRREGQVRFYDETSKARLALILKGKQLGFTLTEIWAMLAANDQKRGDLGLSREQMEERLASLRAERARVDAAIAELEAGLG
ncbi:MerR family transcriptional regulator [Terrarubrum flagellatum]|uniref:MerR family transcriptional regulator n=1 Tax=Terrirubrum flagellatum TaxID=2895980 RepID=UPI0031452B9E